MHCKRLWQTQTHSMRLIRHVKHQDWRTVHLGKALKEGPHLSRSSKGSWASEVMLHRGLESTKKSMKIACNRKSSLKLLILPLRVRPSPAYRHEHLLTTISQCLEAIRNNSKPYEIAVGALCSKKHPSNKPIGLSVQSLLHAPSVL